MAATSARAMRPLFVSPWLSSTDDTPLGGSSVKPARPATERPRPRNANVERRHPNESTGSSRALRRPSGGSRILSTGAGQVEGCSDARLLLLVIDGDSPVSGVASCEELVCSTPTPTRSGVRLLR